MDLAAEQGRRDTNMPTSTNHPTRQSWLVGVPKKSAPPAWWRFFFWRDAMGSQKVPEHLRSAGMHCPLCRNRQPFSDRCAFCGCDFACFVVINTNKVSRNKRSSNETAPLGSVKQGVRCELIARLGKTSLRTRAITLGVTSLLLILLVTGIVQYRGYVQRNYSKNFVLALYVMKSGMNISEMVCNGTYSAWRGEDSSVPLGSSGSGPQILADMKYLKAETNKIMGELGAPSGEYIQAAQTLQKLYALYEKTDSIVISSLDSLSRHGAEIAATREAFSREIKNLKANLPAPLAEELKKAGKKYDLRFMAAEK